MRVRVVFLPDCPLILSLFKHRDIRAFLNIKMKNPNKKSLLNNSIDIYAQIVAYNPKINARTSNPGTCASSTVKQGKIYIKRSSF